MTKREKLLNLSNFKLDKYKIIPLTNELQDIEPLGEGGSGIVYLANQYFTATSKVKRAIKFFIFKDELQEKLGTYVSSDNFQDEIVNISLFNHENLIKVIDGGIYTSNNVDIPYIITDFVEGRTLEELLNDKPLLSKYFLQKERIFDLFLQILKGLSYLHKRKFYHCDIAPKNIFIKLFDGDFHVIIGDLGVGKTINPTFSNSHLFKVIGTREYMTKEVEEFKDKTISGKDFLLLQPKWDIYATCKTFLETIDIVFEADKANLSWLNALKSILKKGQNKTAEQLLIEVERVQPIHRKIAGLAELSESDSGSWKKLVPIQNVLFTKRIEKIAHHPMLIRLKKVPQLLMGSTIFAGSNHTRYEHCLGTYENMRFVLIQLQKKEKFIELFDTELFEYALLSAILSNVTRFPYSFAIHEVKNMDSSKFRKINQKNLINSILNYKEENKGFKYSLKDVIDQHFNISSIEILKDIISGNTNGFEKPQHRFIYSLVNSSIDVRVLDFLRRDPYHLGLNNGIQFDFESLVSFLDIHNHRVAISTNGVSYVEQVVATRYWMYKNIYWNIPNRSYTAILKQILGTLDNDAFQDELLNSLLFADPLFLLNFFEAKATERGFIEIVDLLHLLNSNRPRIFKQLFVINKSEDDSVLNGACNKIAEMDFDTLNNFRISLEKHLSNIIPFDENKVNLLIDIPIDKNKKLGEDIDVIKRDKAVIKIRDLSGIISGINNYFDSHLQWLRVYIHPDYKDILKENDNYKKASNAIKAFLIQKL